mmetsp:Transcript_20886/g.37712  ORF Transcript_20886/g.37712 Transcript_20886/m.37712 type:complete len:95 (-) Transcript_20886:528-812(-)
MYCIQFFGQSHLFNQRSQDSKLETGRSLDTTKRVELLWAEFTVLTTIRLPGTCATIVGESAHYRVNKPHGLPLSKIGKFSSEGARSGPCDRLQV